MNGASEGRSGGPFRGGRVVVISGPSGVGKSTVCHRLCKLVPAEFSVSVTTRPPRPGEQNAHDYHYVSPEEFETLQKSDRLLECAEVYGNRYGTLTAPVERIMAEGRVIVLEIDINGCIQVRRKLPQARTFFLLPPTAEEQKRRIEHRRTDSSEIIRRRLEKADGEIRYARDSGVYEAFIINEDLDETVRTIHEAIMKE